MNRQHYAIDESRSEHCEAQNKRSQQRDQRYSPPATQIEWLIPFAILLEGKLVQDSDCFVDFLGHGLVVLKQVQQLRVVHFEKHAYPTRSGWVDKIKPRLSRTCNFSSKIGLRTRSKKE
jgi:hypothetical protein